MLNINIISVGKLKEDYLKSASKEYEKRISAYAKLKIFEVDEERLSDNPSEKEIEKALKTEGEKILTIAKKSTIIALCIEGKEFSSVDFSKEIEKLEVSGISDISFVIGSSFGLHNIVKESAKIKISFSRMTFPHQLCRIILLEQIYRAMNIKNKGKYHK